MRRRSVRLTLTHDDFNVLLGALEMEDEYIRDYEGAASPYRLEIGRVESKLQKARDRMHRLPVPNRVETKEAGDA